MADPGVRTQDRRTFRQWIFRLTTPRVVLLSLLWPPLILLLFYVNLDFSPGLLSQLSDSYEGPRSRSIQFSTSHPVFMLLLMFAPPVLGLRFWFARRSRRRLLDGLARSPQALAQSDEAGFTRNMDCPPAPARAAKPEMNLE